jgi:hypothetical protein
MSMTLDAFNGLLQNFVEELQRTFPEEQGLEYFSEELQLLMKANTKAPLTLFMNALSPYTNMVVAKDSKLFDQPINLGKHLNLKKLWSTKDLSAATRDAIWQHVYTLFMLGMSLQYMTPEMLSGIEDAAKNVAERMQAGESLDFGAMMSTVAGLMNQATSQTPAQQPSKRKQLK